MKKIKPAAILFDMDGVLVDSLDSWWKSLNDSLEAYNYDKISKEEFVKKHWGHDLRDNLEKMNVDEGVLTFCNNVYGDYVSDVEIFSDTKNTLQQLDDFKKAIITNTPDNCTDQILEKTGLRKYFDAVVTSDHVSIGKPNPEIIFKACSLLNVKPEDCILVGDTKSDVEAGKKAGCKVIGIKTKGDYTAEKISDIIKFIKS